MAVIEAEIPIADDDSSVHGKAGTGVGGTDVDDDVVRSASHGESSAHAVVSAAGDDVVMDVDVARNSHHIAGRVEAAGVEPSP